MAMGTRTSEQAPIWIPTTELPVSPGHPFYARLNAILDEAGFDRFAEEQCQAFYAPVMGRPGLPPGRNTPSIVAPIDAAGVGSPGIWLDLLFDGLRGAAKWTN